MNSPCSSRLMLNKNFSFLQLITTLDIFEKTGNSHIVLHRYFFFSFLCNILNVAFCNEKKKLYEVFVVKVRVFVSNYSGFRHLKPWNFAI